MTIMLSRSLSRSRDGPQRSCTGGSRLPHERTPARLVRPPTAERDWGFAELVDAHRVELVVHCPPKTRNEGQELAGLESELEHTVLNAQAVTFAKARYVTEPSLARQRCGVDVVGYEVSGQGGGYPCGT